MTNKWLKMAEIYKRFCPKEDCYDFSERSATDMFNYESTGNPKLSLTDKVDGKFNGFVIGKHWMDAFIKMWKEDLTAGLLFRLELEQDFPEWFLNKVLK